MTMQHKKTHKPVAKAKTAGKTNTKPDSLVRCEVKLESGLWISPSSCEKFYIDEEAKFPEIIFEIKTNEIGPYKWEWNAKWVVMACPQKRGKNRFKANSSKIFQEKGSFDSASKRWKADLNSKVIGGDLTVKVIAGQDTFVRKILILGKDPSQSTVDAEIDTYAKSYLAETRITKEIFKQESHYHQFYSDDMPLTSFDNGYGLGQATSPPPSYEQTWDWKEHVKYIVTNVIHSKRNAAKNYLDKHGNYGDEELDTETLVYYNGANYHYYVWDEKSKKWAVNDQILCDPNQSNSGWNMTLKANKEKELKDLQDGKGTKPIYTGRCYAEHIKNSN